MESKVTGREFSSGNVKQSIHKNVIEEKELRSALARIDGERIERMYEIRKSKDDFVRRHFKQSQSDLRRKSDALSESSQDVVNSTRPHRLHKNVTSGVQNEATSLNNKDYKREHSSKRWTPREKLTISLEFDGKSDTRRGLYRSKTEGFIRHYDSKSNKFDSHAFAYNRSVSPRSESEDDTDDDSEYTEIDDETKEYAPKSPVIIARSRSDSALKTLSPLRASTSFTAADKVRQRVKSEEKLDYLLLNVFERLHAGFSRKRPNVKTERPNLGTFRSLKSCRYLRLPFLNKQIHEGHRK